jgi:hypothetical protein
MVGRDRKTWLDDRIKAAIILSKLSFATGVLGIPSALVVTGYAPGVILLVGWGALHTCELNSIGYDAERRLRLHHVSVPDEICRCA